MKPVATQRPQLENLEDRCVPSANVVALQGGVLNILTNQRQAHTAVISQPDEGVVRVELDGQQFEFTEPVNQIFYRGGRRSDNVQNNTNIQAVLLGGRGHDVFVGGTGDDVIDAGAGHNHIQDPSGNNVLLAGNGRNNIYGGSQNDLIQVGRGRNIIYDLLGENNIALAPRNGGRAQHVFTNAASTVEGETDNDKVVRFFDTNRLPGSGTVVFEDGILYFTGNNDGNTFRFDRDGRDLVVTYDLNDGNGAQEFRVAYRQVRFLAGFGGSGDDVIVNNTRIGMVAYGAGGNDFLAGGRGRINLLKGGSGDDVIVARGRYNDLSGNSGDDALIGRVGRGVQNIFRTDEGDEVLGVNPGDVFLGPMP